jgi:hypothetical protein
MNTLETARTLKSSPLGTVFILMLKKIKSLHDADEQYRQLIIALDGLWSAGYRFNSPEVQSIVNILRELPSYGSRRRNFERLYLQDEYTLKKLPKDPRDFPFGHWAR